MFRRAVLAPLQSNQSSDLENPFESCADEDTSFSTEKSYFSDDNSNHHISKTKLAPLEKIETKNDQEAFVADQEDEDDDIISNYTPENSSRSFSDQNNENAVIYQEQSENNEASDGKFDEDLENEDDEISFNISKHIESSQNFMNQIQNEIIDVSSQEVKTEEMQKPDPNLRVTFTPEVHAMAFLNYTRNQYLKSQQCEGYDENEEEEEEYQRQIVQRISEDVFYEDNYEDSDHDHDNNMENHEIPVLDLENSIPSYEPIEYNDENGQNDSDSNLHEDETNNDIESDNNTKQNNDIEFIENEQEKAQQSEKENIEEENELLSENVQCGTSLTNNSPEKPFIPALDLANSIPSLRKLNKNQPKISNCALLSHGSSSTHKAPEPVIPVISNNKQTRPNSHLNKNNSPPRNENISLENLSQQNFKFSKNHIPIKTQIHQNLNQEAMKDEAIQNKIMKNETFNEERMEKEDSDVQRQNQNYCKDWNEQTIESKAEELKNNGFMITFLQSPKVTNSKVSSSDSSNSQKLSIPQLNINFTNEGMITSSKTSAKSSAKSSSNNSSKKPKKQKQDEAEEDISFTDEELNNAIDRLLDTKKLPPKEMHKSLIVYLKKNIFKNIIDQDYDEAERLKTAQDLLLAETNIVCNDQEKKSIVKSIEQRIESTKDKLHESKKQWKLKFDNFEIEIQNKLQELQIKHDEEIENFEKTWNSQEVLLQFNKPSAQLLEIRKLQRTKALSGDFSGAKDLKARGDRLEKEETKRAETRATNAMKAAYSKLLEKQKRELEYANQNWNHQRSIIEIEKDQEIHSIELTLKQLQIKLKESKVKSPSCLSAIAAATKKKAKKNSREVTTPTTPRTRKQMVEFRAAPRQDKLALNGIHGVHNYVRSKNKISKISSNYNNSILSYSSRKCDL